MDTSEASTGERGRAHSIDIRRAEGVLDSDIHTQSIYKKSRLEDLHLAFVMEKGVVK